MHITLVVTKMKGKNLKDISIIMDTINFCENWDQKSFDPNFKSLTLNDFEPYVKKIFSRKPYSK